MEARLLAGRVSFKVVSTAHAKGIEDRTTMAPLAARRLAEMVELGGMIVAIERAVRDDVLFLKMSDHVPDVSALAAAARRDALGPAVLDGNGAAGSSRGNGDDDRA